MLIQYQCYKLITIIFFFIVINFTTAQTFHTEAGQCSIENYKTSNIKKTEEVIINETIRLVSKYGKIKKSPFTIVICNTQKEFYYHVEDSPSWASGITLNQKNKIIIKSPGLSKLPYNRFIKIIIHELNHLYIYRLLYNISLPGWFLEGMAMKSAKEFTFTQKILISEAIWKKRILPLEKIYNFHTQRDQNIKLAYAQSALAINAIEYYYGKQALLNILKNIKKTKNFWESFYNITKDPKELFFEKYFYYIQKNYKWMFLFKINNLIFIILPLILILSFIVKKNKNKLTIEKWEQEEELNHLYKDKEHKNHD